MHAETGHAETGTAPIRAGGGFAGLVDALGRLAATSPARLAVAAIAPFLVLQFAAYFVLATGPHGYAAWAEDDFFYYAVIAGNIAETGRSTWDGVTLTNGYHPLWTLICAGVASVFEVRSASFFMAVWMLQAALVAGGTAVFARLARSVAGHLGLPPGGALIAAAVYGLSGAAVATGGMEIALLWPTVPALMLAIWRLLDAPSTGRAVIAAGLLTLAFLSRLDSVVVLGPLCLAAAILLVRRQGLAAFRMWPAAFAFAPAFGYLVLNKLVFGTPMPLSGAAKRLMVDGAGLAFSGQALGSFVEVHTASNWLAPVGVLAMTVLAAALVLGDRKLRASLPGMAFLLTALGAAIYYAQTLLTSDWRLWAWYFYAICFTGSAGALFLAGRALELARRIDTRALAVLPLAIVGAMAAAAVLLNAWQLKRPPSETNALFLRAIPIAEFVKANPGRYAMGDGAGAVGFLMDNPPVHLEGLVNDQAMLDDIAAQGRVSDSLRRQGVDYYIATRDLQPSGCVTVHEPLQPGPRAPRMSQEVCDKPVFTDQTQWIPTQIWDVRGGLN